MLLIRLITFVFSLAIATPVLALGSVAENARVAYDDLIGQFWVGDAQTGYLVINAGGRATSAADRESRPPVGSIWRHAEGWNAIYAYWKITGSSDAQSRLAAEWRWVKRFWTVADMRICGRVPGHSATTQDDSSWMAMGLLQLYEATGDRNAMAFAKNAIECALVRWDDDAIGGGLWYDDEHKPNTGKQTSNGNFALAMLILYEDTCKLGNCDNTLLTKVEEIENWARNHLLRRDSLYWMFVNGDGGLPNGGQENIIYIGKSVVALFGNMGFAALDALLYRITQKVVYRDLAVQTAKAILVKETSNGVFIDDRDARGNGYAAWHFAADVAPLLLPDRSIEQAYLETGKAVIEFDRSAEGLYGGDWAGPVNGVWENLGFHRKDLEITANAVIWPIVSSKFARR